MQKALRPYVTAAMALAGASLIAVTPVTPTPPDVQTRRVSLTSSGTDILTPYEDLYTTTVANVQSAGQDWLDHPFPVLSQIATNWTGYIDQVIADPQSITSIPGEILAHLESLLTTLLPQISADFLPLPGQLSVELTGLLSLLVGVVGPVVTTINELGQIIGEVSSAGDPTTLFTDLADAPAELVNAFLNGQATIDGIPFSGLLVAGQSIDTDVTLGELLNGLGSLVNGLQGVLNAVGEGGVNISGLYDQVFDSSLGTLLGDLGQGNLNLATLLSDLPGVGNVTLGSLLGLGTSVGGQTLGGETVGDLLGLATGSGGQTLGSSTLGTLLNLATGSGGQTLGGSTLGDLLNLATGSGGQTLGGSTLGTLLNLVTGSGGQTLGGSTLGDLLNLATGSGGQTLGGETLASLLGLATGAGGQTLGGETLGSLLGLATGPGQTLGGSTLGDLLNLATGPSQTLGDVTLGETAPGTSGGLLDDLGLGSTNLDTLLSGLGLGGMTLGTVGTQKGLLDDLGLGGMTLGEATPGTSGGLLDALGLGSMTLGETTAGTSGGLLDALGLGGMTLGEATPGTSGGLLDALGLGSTTLGPTAATIPANTTLSVASLQNDLQVGSLPEYEFIQLYQPFIPGMTVTYSSTGDTVDTNSDTISSVLPNTNLTVGSLQEDLGLETETTSEFESYLSGNYPDMTITTPEDTVDTGNIEFCFPVSCGSQPPFGETETVIPENTTLSVASLQQDFGTDDSFFQDETLGEFEQYLLTEYEGSSLALDIPASLDDTVDPEYSIYGPGALGGSVLIPDVSTLSVGALQSDLALQGGPIGSYTPEEFEEYLADEYPQMVVTHESLVDTGPYTITGVSADTTLSLGSLQNDLGLDGETTGEFVPNLIEYYGVGPTSDGPGMTINLSPDEDTVDTGMDNLPYLIPGSGLLNELGLGNMSLLTLLNDLGLSNVSLVSLLNELGVNTGANVGDETVDQLLNAAGIANESLATVLANTGVDLGSVIVALANDTDISAIETAASVFNSALNVLGINTGLDQLFSGVSVQSLLDTLGLGGISLDQLLTGDDQTLGELVSGLDLNTSTLNSLVSELGLSNDSLDTLVGDVGLNSTSLDTLVTNLGLNADSLDTLVSNLGLNAVSLDTLVGNLGLGSDSLNGLLGNLGLGNVSLDTLVSNLGLNSMSLATLLGNLGLSNVSLDTLLGNLGLTNVSLDGLLGDLGLSNVSLDTLLGGLGLNSVGLDALLGALGLNNVSLDGLLGDLGLNNVSLNGLLGDLGLSNVSLNGLLGDLGLSNVSLDGLLGDLGLNTVSLETLLSGLNLSGVSVDSLLSELNLGSLSLGDLLSDLGLDNMDLANIDVGAFDGLAPAGVDYLVEIAQALGA